ncbi:DUF2493 domain-containing protein [Flammeovirga aprica]|uniref:DUF2493 domain-containing protein n=1 Tax=Flammeovirga aprica JL-4 TaxID=694437 RepID=A0A7X9XBB7_9BACT|nr:DUF2493 domain-containing protein [Flammeovirga aprica]NME70570.1 DUF2493 domain-containing protein [Flammeovirga aprica JL-4]
MNHKVLKKHRIIIAGTRSFDDYSKLEKEVLLFIQQHHLPMNEIQIVSGACRGADQLGERFAENHNLPVKQFLADWSKGKIAGPLRNQEMAKYGTHLVCFWDGVSTGAKGMCRVAFKEGVKVKVVKYGRGESLTLF